MRKTQSSAPGAGDRSDVLNRRRRANPTAPHPTETHFPSATTARTAQHTDIFAHQQRTTERTRQHTRASSHNSYARRTKSDYRSENSAHNKRLAQHPRRGASLHQCYHGTETRRRRDAGHLILDPKANHATGPTCARR